MQIISNSKQAQSGGVCIIGSTLVNPVFGWALAMMLENAGFVGNIERGEKIPRVARLIIPMATFVICTVAMALVGLLPGIPALINGG